jgi:hypothetical protein
MQSTSAPIPHTPAFAGPTYFSSRYSVVKYTQGVIVYTIITPCPTVRIVPLQLLFAIFRSSRA